VVAFVFGSFVMDTAERRVTYDGESLALTGKTFDVLRMLVEARGQLVERDTFIARLWPGTTVEEHNLTVHVSTLRRLFRRADPTVDPVETVARIGYRLTLAVRDAAMAGSSREARPPADIAAMLRQAREQLDLDERMPAFKALTLFEHVLMFDPDCAAAHAGLAATYLMLASTRTGRPMRLMDVLPLARDAAERALALDGRQAEALRVRGELKMLYAWDWAGADADLARAVALDPQSADAHEARGWFLSAVGRHGEAVESLGIASALVPRRQRTWELLGMARWVAGDGEGGIADLKTAISLDSMTRRPHARLMYILDDLGRHDEAMAERTAWVRLIDQAPLAARLEELHRAGQHRAAMIEFIAYLGRIYQDFEIAMSWMVIDGHSQALEALQRCIDTRADGAVLAGTFPPMRPLAGDPRYFAILRTLGLERFAATALQNTTPSIRFSS
jgi:DNA-binding winged helix-turn-helix (wHTH) protein